MQQLYARAERIEQARKQLDQYVQSQCVGLSSAACTTKLQSSQATAGVVTEIFAGFTPAGFAVDIKDLLQANTMQDRSLAVLGIVLPGLGDGVKALMKGARPIDGALADVWKQHPTSRGNAIESHLAATEYKDWFNVGQLNNGKLPLVDFQKENFLVSLKTVDTSGASWTRDMRKHIDDLSSGRATVNDKPAAMVLDLRTQPGGAAAAQWLVEYGRVRGVAVRVSEFK